MNPVVLDQNYQYEHISFNLYVWVVTYRCGGGGEGRVVSMHTYIS